VDRVGVKMSDNFTSDIIDAVLQEIVDTRDRLAAKTFQNLIYANPVDTGRSRASWYITLNEPSSEKLPPGSYSLKVALEHETIPPGGKLSPVYITNNQDYIQALNEGKSKQADAGWVESAVERAEAWINDEL